MDRSVYRTMGSHVDAGSLEATALKAFYQSTGERLIRPLRVCFGAGNLWYKLLHYCSFCYCMRWGFRYSIKTSTNQTLLSFAVVAGAVPCWLPVCCSGASRFTCFSPATPLYQLISQASGVAPPLINPPKRRTVVLTIYPTSMDFPGFNKSQLDKAISSLLKYVGDQDKSNQLLDDDELFHLVVSLKKAPVGPRKDKPIKLPIPHPLYTAEGAEICLFVKDHKGEGHKAAKQRLAKLVKNGGIAKVGSRLALLATKR